MADDPKRPPTAGSSSPAKAQEEEKKETPAMPGRTLGDEDNPRGLATKSLADRPVKFAPATVDARLDNRVGDERPPLLEFPATPQQVDGGEVTDPIDRPVARKVSKQPSVGMHSVGPHGLGPDTADKV